MEKENIIEMPVEKISKWCKFKSWCKDHQDALLGIAGGLLTLAGACVGLYSHTKECSDYLYIAGTNDDIYRVPAKKVPAAKHKEMVNE